MRIIKPLILAMVLAGCASYDGRGLRPGVSTVAETEQVMGAPAMRWSIPGGGELLAYPRGPMGYQTYMATFASNGRMASLENVLQPKYFALIRVGMTQDEVLRTLGPSPEQWTLYYKARDELVWEWRWCDDYSEPARFNVLFDGSSRTVRSTASLTERQSMPFGRGDRREWCSR